MRCRILLLVAGFLQVAESFLRLSHFFACASNLFAERLQLKRFFVCVVGTRFQLAVDGGTQL